MKALNEQILLGIDPGSKVMGLAIWQPRVKMANPIRPIKRKVIKSDLIALKKVIDEEKIEGVVVGLPLTLSERISPSTETALFWVQKLKETWPEIPVHTWDESLSTREALGRLSHTSRSARKEMKDSMAAAIILEEFCRAQ